MKNSPHNLSPPGAIFLRTARLLYADHAVSVVFLSAIADFQNELREAGGDRVAHFVARCRWYWALLSLLLATPFFVPKSLRADQAALTRTIVTGFPVRSPWKIAFRRCVVMLSGVHDRGECRWIGARVCDACMERRAFTRRRDPRPTDLMGRGDRPYCGTGVHCEAP